MFICYSYSVKAFRIPPMIISNLFNKKEGIYTVAIVGLPSNIIVIRCCPYKQLQPITSSNPILEIKILKRYFPYDSVIIHLRLA